MTDHYFKLEDLSLKMRRVAYLAKVAFNEGRYEDLENHLATAKEILLEMCAIRADQEAYLEQEDKG